MMLRIIYLVFINLVIVGPYLSQCKTEESSTSKSDAYEKFTKQCMEISAKLKNQPAPEITKEKNELLASPAEFASTVLIGYGANYVLTLWLCGGTIISTRFILSAAHCANHPKAGRPSRALLGELDAGTDNDATVSRYIDIISILVHPGYKDGSIVHDLALLLTEKDIEISPYIQPACIGLQMHMQETWSPGWGVNIDDPFLKSFHMKRGKVLVDEKNPCSLTNQIIDTSRLICFNNNDLNCQSDGGGGLYTKGIKDGINTLNIIAVRSLGNCSEKTAVYTKIDPYVSWIASHVL